MITLEVSPHSRIGGPVARAFDPAFVVCERREWSRPSDPWRKWRVSDVSAFNFRCVISAAQHEWHITARIDSGAVWAIVYHPEVVGMLLRMRFIDRANSRIELAIDNLYRVAFHLTLPAGS
jgi:hypothetical protein